MEEQLEGSERVQPAIDRKHLEKLLRECLQLMEELGAFDEFEEPLARAVVDEEKGERALIVVTSDNLAAEVTKGENRVACKSGYTLRISFKDNDEHRLKEDNDEECLNAESVVRLPELYPDLGFRVERREKPEEQIRKEKRATRMDIFAEPEVLESFNEWFESSELVRDPRTGKPSYKALGDLMGVDEHTAKRYLSGESLPTKAAIEKLKEGAGEQAYLEILRGPERPYREPEDIERWRLTRKGEKLLEKLHMPELEMAIELLGMLTEGAKD